MRRPEFIARHAKLPSGLLGRLLARITSYETRGINRAALDALDLRPADRVLEIACGRGRTAERAAQITVEGQVTGIDHSGAVIRAAARRCRRWIEQGRIRFEVADSARLPFADGSFDKAYCVHAIYFWENPLEHLREVRRTLGTAGRFALGMRTRSPDKRHEAFPDSIYTFYETDAVAAMLRDSGFAEPQVLPVPGGAADLVIIVAGAR